MDAEAKTVSVKGISNTSTAPIIIPSIAKDGEEGYAVTTIEDKGFYGFSNVTSITLNEGLIHIGNRAFTKTTKVAGNIVIPSTVTFIGTAAFSGMINLTTRDTFKIMGKDVEAQKMTNTQYDSIFGGGTNAIVSIPDGSLMTYAKKYYWESIDLVSSTEIKRENVCYKIIGNEAQIMGYGQTPQGSIQFLDTVKILGKNYLVTSVVDSAFHHTNIVSLVFPKHLASIGKASFRNCNQLQTILFNDGVLSIGERAFTACANVSGNLIIPSSIQKIGNAAFYGLNKLDTIFMQSTLPPTCDVLKDIQYDSIFGGGVGAVIYVPCGSVSAYTKSYYTENLNISSNCETIIDNIIYQSKNETEAHIVGYKKNIVGKYNFHANIKIGENTYSVTEVADSAFHHTSITELSLPSSITAIGMAAFRNCNSLKTISSLGENLLSIGERAFTASSNIDGIVEFPHTLQVIGKAAFYNCNKIANIHLLSQTPPIVIPDGIYTAFTCDEATVSIPCGTFLEYKHNAFWSNFNLVDPCTNLIENVYYTLTDTGMIVVGYDTLPSQLAFKEQVTINGQTKDVVSIANRAFDGVQTLTSVTIPSSVKYVNNCAFLMCQKLSTLTLNEGIKLIGDSCFFGCVFTTLKTPTTLQNIGSYAFRDNSQMKTLVLNEGLEIIGERSFTNNSNLTETLIIP
ncbi:MAG: leucine-rich repeat protein, partial [Agathobacter sp.]